MELEERRQFRVLLNPVRQDILHLLRRAARPMTAREVAERVMLSPIAAQGHLKKLVELGVVEQEERTARDGRRTSCYHIADVELRICLGRKDAFQGEREALPAGLVDGTFRGLIHTGGKHAEEELGEYQQLLFGAVHLKTEEREELIRMIEAYLRAHAASAEGVEHWEYVLMAYRADEL